MKQQKTEAAQKDANMGREGSIADSMREEIMESANIGLWELEFLTGQEPRLNASPAMLKLMGIDESYKPEAVFFYHRTRIYSEDFALFLTYSDEIVNSGKAEIVYRWIHPQYGMRYVRCSGFLKEKSERGICMNGYHQDITEMMSFRKEQEEKLASINAISKQRMDIISAYSGIYFMSWIVNIPEDRVTIIKKPESGYEELNILQDGGEASETVDSVCSTCVVEEYREAVKKFMDYSTIQQRFEHEKRLAIEYRGSNKEWCRLVAIPLSSEDDGTLREVLMAVQEITEQKKKELENTEALEHALEEARKANSAKTEFLRKMSHDVRTPLNGILGMVTIARMNADNKSILDNALQKIDEAGRQLEQLLGDVLDMSRLESGRQELAHEQFDLHKLLRQCGDLQMPHMKRKQIQILGIHVNCEHLLVMGSPVHVMRILQNLVSNAVKYNKFGGTLELWLEEEEIDWNHSLYRLRIQDSGIGMSEEFQEKIFEPFSQEKQDARTEFQGSGLGMAITRELVTLMGGRIRFESRLGEGTTFYVELPFEICHTRKAVSDERPKRKVDLRGRMILLAEDNALNRQIVQYLLQDVGAGVVCVENGQEAVNSFEHSEPGDYDLILMDIMMPETNGLDAARAIRRMDRPDAAVIPIVAMTANAFTEDVNQALEAGMNAHISKPIDVPTMMNVIGELLQRE